VTFVFKAANHTGVMVALFPSPDVAQQLAQPGGEPVEDLHVTLAFLGDAMQLANPEALKQEVAAFAARTPPIAGTVSGVGHFTAGPEPVTYASVDLPTLPAIRESLVENLSWDENLPDPSREHGFTPHLTLAYDDRQVELPNLPLTFDTITLCIGDERIDFPLYGTRKAEVWTVPIWKAATTVPPPGVPLTVYGVVMHPYGKDSQGDETPAAEIEKAAHRWMIEARAHDVQHDGVKVPDAHPVESFIAPMDLVFKADDGSEQTVLKGSWVVGVAVHAQQLKAAVVEGRYTGFSIGGSAMRSEALAAV
jgi:2'-5' RNA ligase